MAAWDGPRSSWKDQRLRRAAQQKKARWHLLVDTLLTFDLIPKPSLTGKIGLELQQLGF